MKKITSTQLFSLLSSFVSSCNSGVSYLESILDARDWCMSRYEHSTNREIKMSLLLGILINKTTRKKTFKL